MRLDPLEQRTMPEGIAQVLRRAILAGELKQGEPLRETQLSTALGVSRAPLREAFRLLEEDGLVNRRAFKGSAVAVVDAQAVRQIAVVRQRVEPLAIQLGIVALQTESAEELSAAVMALRGATSAGDIAGSIEAHIAVHRLFYTTSRNSVLADMWRSWESRLQLFWVADHQSFAKLTDVAESHERLLDLIVAGDLDVIELELHGHVHGWSAAERQTRQVQ